MKFSDHFESERAHWPDRQRITLAMCERVREGYLYLDHGRFGRTVYWGRVQEPDKVRYLRVIVEPDDYEIASANFDRDYSRKARRGDRPQ